MRILSPNPTIQLWASQFGGDGVLPETVPALAAALPTKPESHPVPGAAHFAFLAPCSPQLAKAAPEICLDGNGFDRAAFHREMNGKVAAFFAARLKGADLHDSGQKILWRERGSRCVGPRPARSAPNRAPRRLWSESCPTRLFSSGPLIVLFAALSCLCRRG